MTETRKMIELNDDDVRPFVLKTQNLGRAEFTFCTLYKRGKVNEVFIYPRQQENIDYYYHIACGYSDSFQVSSWSHKGVADPKVWLHFWCKDHKCASMHVYPPDGTNSFRVSTGSTLSIYFEER